MAEFGLHAIERESPLTIVGRCHRGPIRIGSRFTLFAEEGGEEHVVSLEVVRMEAYRRELDEVADGLTARLVLSGTGGESLTGRGVLRTCHEPPIG